MKLRFLLNPLALISASVCLLASPNLQADEESPRKFVVYASTWTGTTFSQSYADDAPVQADPTGRRASKYTYRFYEVVDLGDQVDDGIDLTFPRDVDDNMTFTLNYDPRTKTYYDWNYQESWTQRQEEENLFGYRSGIIQTRSKIKSRFELREYRYYNSNNEFVYDDDLEQLVLNDSWARDGYTSRGEGVVSAVTLPVTLLFPRGQQPVVWIPKKLVFNESFYSYNPAEIEYDVYDEDLEEWNYVVAPGKANWSETTKGTSIYNATVTAWVNGLRGALVDPVSSETLQPGSQAYAGLALVSYLKSLRYTNDAEFDDEEEE